MNKLLPPLIFINDVPNSNRERIVENLTEWKNDNSCAFYYKNANELLDEVIELIRKGKV